MESYTGFVPPPNWHIARIDASSISPADFFARFVSTRTPCVVSNAPPDWFPRFRGERLSPAHLKDPKIAERIVQVEEKVDGKFGSGRDRLRMPVGELVDALAKGRDDLYLTTQYDEIATLTSDTESRVASYAHEPLPALISELPTTHPLFPTLSPQQINLWLGRSSNGTSSGLHHDHADNLYILLAGKKRFTILPPCDVANCYMVGSPREIHPNGLIVYERGIRSDGARISDVAAWKLAQDLDDDEEEGALEALLDDADGAGDDFDAEDGDFDAEDGGDFAAESGDDEESADGEASEPNESDESSAEDSGRPGKRPRPLSPDFEEQPNKKPKSTLDPPTFSQIPVSLIHSDSIPAEFENFKKARKTVVNLEEGDMLYLPASWLHEVTSSSGAEKSNASGSLDVHMAVNYWMHPPARKEFESPYEDGYWADLWKVVEGAILSKRNEK